MLIEAVKVAVASGSTYYINITMSIYGRYLSEVGVSIMAGR